MTTRGGRRFLPISFALFLAFFYHLLLCFLLFSQFFHKVSDAVERSLAKGLSDIVDMCEGRIELDYDDEDLEEGKDYEKELWEAFEELEALNNNNKREVEKTKKEPTLSAKPTLTTKPTVVVPNKQLPSGLAMKKLQEVKASKQEKVVISGPSPPELQSVAKAKPNIETKAEVTNTNDNKEKEELRKEEVSGWVIPWFQRGIFFVCKSHVFSESRPCGRRCNGRKIFKEHLTQGGVFISKDKHIDSLTFNN